MIRTIRQIQVPVAAALMLAAGAAFAQSGGPARDNPGSDLLRQRDQELDIARAEQKKAIENEKRLRAEIDSLGEDRRKFNQTLIDGATKVRTIEKRLSENETRIKPLQEQEQSLRTSLDERRSVIAEVLAALQRIGRRPPPAIMVSPEDALQSVRSAILLGAVLPEMREKARALGRSESKLADLKRRVTEVSGAGSERAIEKQHARGKKTARERLEMLLDG